jgi:hypothetical protein
MVVQMGCQVELFSNIFDFSKEEMATRVES